MYSRNHFVWPIALAALLCAQHGPFAWAQGNQAATPTSWELTPYRVEICVVVDPAAQLAPTFEAELTRQLVALAESANGGPWQVAAGQPVTKARSRLLRQLSLLDESPDLKASAGIDKLFVIGISERPSGFLITARELETLTGIWNVPVERSTPQASRLAADSFTAIQSAWGPLLRVDSVDKDTVTVSLKGGSLPKRDGSYLAIDRNATFGLQTLQVDKQGKPQLETLKQVPWSFLTPLTAPGSSATSGQSRATFKCRLYTALAGSPIPDYHPLQLRLAGGLARSTASTKLILVDRESPQPPLEGYEVFLAPIEGNAASSAPVRIGATNRNGEVLLPPGDGTLRRLIISHGGEELFRRPFLPGLRSEARLSLPSDRRRLELAAEIAAAEDEFFDAIGRFAVLSTRMEEAVKKRDVASLNRATGDLKALASLSALTSRAAALEQQLASADEATRRRLEPTVADFKARVEAIKAQFAQLVP